jgi:hypothetical protein
MDKIIFCTQFWDVSCGNFTVIQNNEIVSVKGYHQPRRHDDWDLQIKFLISSDTGAMERLLSMAKTGALTWYTIHRMLNLPESITLFTNKRSAKHFVNLICEQNVESVVYIYHQGTGRWALVSQDSPLRQLW